jgi:hypothetical protein
VLRTASYIFDNPVKAAVLLLLALAVRDLCFRDCACAGWGWEQLTVDAGERLRRPWRSFLEAVRRVFHAFLEGLLEGLADCRAAEPATAGGPDGRRGR